MKWITREHPRVDRVACPWLIERFVDKGVWVIPATRMKNKKAHIVHLSHPAREVLAAIPRIEGQDLIFTTTGKTPGSGLSKWLVWLLAQPSRRL